MYLHFCVFFFLLFNIQIVTPVQSDDYSYLSMAGSIDHYIIITFRGVEEFLLMLQVALCFIFLARGGTRL